MKTLEIEGSSGLSKIVVGESIDHVTDYLSQGHLVIITDETVKKLYSDKFPSGDVITIGSGEENKTLETVSTIYEELIKTGADRSSFILGIGGGIVCDVTGYIASTYMRGLSFGFVSTTLLSQVDASTGGKNGVNFQGFKNMVGVFNQPEFVICDTDMLKTLPEKEISCGFGEIIKHACIYSADYFNYLEANRSDALALKKSVIESIIYESVRIKARVVNQDEREKGERMKLNFGHTTAHGIEKLSFLSHGEAVGVGMCKAADISCGMGYLPKDQTLRISNLVKDYKLPVTTDLDPKALFDAMKKDKKKEQDSVYFILLKCIGEAVIEKITFAGLKKYYQ